MAPPKEHDTLVQYDYPVIVARNQEKRTPGAKKLNKESVQQPVTASVVPGGAKEQVDGNMEETLNTILPPIEWMDDGQLYIKQIKSTKATRQDVAELSEALNKRLVDRQAREAGICPIRRELYTQAFDELIRQITIDGVERGLLLLRTRDEISMTIKAYQTLYGSSVAFGTRKAIIADQSKQGIEPQIAILEQEKRQLEKTVNTLKSECDFIEKKEQERRSVDEKKRTEEIQFLKRTNQQLKQQLDGITANKK